MRQTETMNISVSPENKAFVKAQVASGRYRSDSEVMRTALRLMEDQEARRKLDALLREGLEGESSEFTPEFMDELKDRARKELAKRDRDPA